jgi:hypothetical protein
MWSQIKKVLSEPLKRVDDRYLMEKTGSGRWIRAREGNNIAIVLKKRATHDASRTTNCGKVSQSTLFHLSAEPDRPK